MTTKDQKSAPTRRTQRGRSTSQSANRKRRPSRGTAQATKPERRPNRSAANAAKAAHRPVRSTDRPKRAERRPSRRRAESQVVYTPPKPFNRLRFLLTLATVAAVVLAITLGKSIFFKVGENCILVSGTHKYTEWDIREASGIREGDNLLTLGKARVGGKIIAQLPYVESVRIGIKLPDTVNIEITELDVMYSIQAADNTWWLINGQGRVLEQTSGIIAGNHTQILGVYISNPVAGQQAVAVREETVPQTTETATTPDGETETAPTAPVDTVNAEEQLATALNIIQQMEENGVVGEATSVNVGNLYDLMVVYDNRYEVMLGDATKLPYKIRAMVQAVVQMSDYQQGILDVSFTTWPDKVGYTPFED